VVSVACGDDHTLAIDSKGAVWAWGRNDHHELGMGDDTTKRYTPDRIIHNWTGDAEQVASYGFTSYLLTDKGTVYSWGDNSYGQSGTDIAVGTDVYSSDNVYFTGTRMEDDKVDS
ncbi:hypothetical protein KIPB_013310, partial [Kipferlia bialata]